MARSPRITIPAYPHHIIQRGNNRQVTFFADDDYRALGITNPLLVDDPWYAGLGTAAEERREKYRGWIEPEANQGEWDEIRQSTQRGRLIGRETFQKQVEAMTGRRLMGEARGRPKKPAVSGLEKVLC